MMAALGNWLSALSFRPGAATRRLAASFRIWKQYRELARQRVGADNWPMTFNRPCFAEAEEEGGVASGHYFHQDLMVARWIYERVPRRHVDVGSRVDGFVAHLAVFREVEYLDFRAVTGRVRNMVFKQGDLLRADSLPSGDCESVSCLHVIEHIGLGRYGDPICAEGWSRALANLAGMLSSGGDLYLSVPVGRQRIEYNAHRIFHPQTILRAAAESGLSLSRCAWVDDRGALIEGGAGGVADVERAAGWEYGCGIFNFRLSGRRNA